MLVSIGCEGCSAALGVADAACRACGRVLTREERDALEARFEAASSDYRDAKNLVSRALTVSLVMGLLMLVVASVRLLLLLDSGGGAAAAVPAGAAVMDLLLGLTLVACFVGGKRAPAAAVGIALALSFLVVILPFVAAPGVALLQFASPGGVVLNLARITALMLMTQGALSVRTMRRLLRAGSS